jgi:hypothetical protein
VYDRPVTPHVKNGRDWASGTRPYLSSRMKSETGMESGGAKGSFGTQGGG